jgi:putative membrane protein
MKNIIYFKPVLVQTVLVIVFLLSTFAYSKGQQTKRHHKATPAFSEKEAHFIFAAAAINLKEIQLGELAQQKGRMIEVKELGRRIEVAHRKFSEELAVIAEKKKITTPTLPSDDDQNAYLKLSSKSGTDFDTEYCNMMVTGHKATIRMFEKSAKEFNDPDIKEWITSTLPELRAHLAYALQCQKKSNKIEITQE